MNALDVLDGVRYGAGRNPRLALAVILVIGFFARGGACIEDHPREPTDRRVVIPTTVAPPAVPTTAGATSTWEVGR